MKKKKYLEKIDWNEIDSLLKSEDVYICLPNNYIGIKKNDNFLFQLKLLIKYFTQINSTHWIVFYFDSDFSLVNESIEKTNSIRNNSEKIKLEGDISLISLEGKIEDTLYLLNEEFKDEQDIVNFNKIIHGNKTSFIKKTHLRVMSSLEVGTKADLFIRKNTLGRYHLDPACAPFTGVAYEYKTPSYNQYNYGYGRSFDFKSAKCVASLEAVERFASQFYSFKYDDKFKVDSYNNLREEAINPQKFCLENFSKVNTDTKLIWTETYSVRENLIKMIPEDLIYYGNNPSRENYIREINDSSNGVALGSNYAEAMICALLELIERHSFLSVWYGQLPGKKIKNYETFLDVEEKKSLQRILGKKVSLDLFEISVFNDVYVVWGLVRDSKKQTNMASYTSAGSGMTLKEAVKAAFLEVSIGYLVQKNYHDQYPKIPKKVETIDDHIEYYGNPKNLNKFYFTEMFNVCIGEEYKDINYIKEFGNQESLLRYLLDEVLKDYPEIYFSNLTSKSMKKNNLCVVKAVIPGFLPMTFGEDNLRINLTNINKIRKNKDLDELTYIERKPHPFP